MCTYVCVCVVVVVSVLVVVLVRMQHKGQRLGVRLLAARSQWQ